MSHINLVRESNIASNAELFCLPEKAKIKVAMAHFVALDTDCAKSSPENWRV